MARPWRIQFEGAVYHITSRGNNRQDIFFDDGDRLKFLDFLGRACERFNLQVLAFCLMGNHFHLFLRTAEPNLSKAMQWINGTYTGYFNHRHQRIGHLLQGRYKSVLLTDEAHYLHLSMYIHLNPVRARIVSDPAEYRWSSFRDYTHLKSRFEWLSRDEILSNYGAGKNGRFRQYRKECLALAGTRPDFLKQIKSGIISGSAEKMKELIKRYQPSGKIEDVSDYTSAGRKGGEPLKELERVAETFGVELEDLRRWNQKSLARQAAYYHLVENWGISITEAAKILGVKRSAVSMGIKKIRKEMEKGKVLKRKLEKLKVKEL